MRQLSGYEACIFYRSIQNVYKSFIVGADYPVSLSVPKILKTLSLLCNEYPVFSLIINKENLEIDYLTNWIPDESLIDVYESEKVEDILPNYQTFEFDYDSKVNPLWKLVYFKNSNTLLFVIDHTFMDGTGAKNFHSEFLKCFNSIDNDDNNLLPELIKTDKFDEYPDPTVEMNFGESLINERIDSPSEISDVKFDLNSDLMKLPMSNHRSTLIHLNKEQVDNLLKRSHELNVKLTAYIYKIACDSVPIEGNTKVMIPINAKRDRKFGLFFGKYFQLKTADVEVFQNNLIENIPNAMTSFENFEINYKKFGKSFANDAMIGLKNRNNNPTTTIAISNLGKLDGGFNGKVYFDQPLVDAYLALHFLSNSSGEMVVNCECHRAIDESVYKSYLNNVIKYLNK